jgi:Bacterial Ig domain
MGFIRPKHLLKGLGWVPLVLALLLLALWFWMDQPGIKRYAQPRLDASSLSLTTGQDGAITGTADPGSDVCIVDNNGKVLSHVTAGPDGRFNLVVPAAVAGTAAYQIIAGHVNGFNVGPSAELSVAVADQAVAAAPAAVATATAAPAAAAPTATSAPAATATSAPAATATSAPTATPVPAPTETAAPAAPIVPSIAGLTAGGVVVACDVKELTGQASPNASVEVFDGNRSLGTATADASGKWTLAIPDCLALGERALTVRGEAGTSEAVNVFAVAAPVIAQPRNPRPGRALPLNGTGTAGSTVTVTAGDKPVCTVQVGANGRWACTLPAELAIDKQNIKVVAVAADGKAVVDGNAVEVSFTPLLPVTGGN